MTGVRVKIAFVEDDADDRFFISSALQEILGDVDIASFASALEFFRMLEAGQVKPNVIVTDLRMPVMNGFDLIKKVKDSDNFHIPIAVLSTSENEKDIEQALKLGASGYYVKPNALNEYEAIFRKIIDSCDKPFLSFISWLRGEDPLSPAFSAFPS